MSKQYQIPATPRVISPSPTPSEVGDGGSYFAPTTRSAAKRASASSAIAEEDDPDLDAETRARARSRSPRGALRKRRPSGLVPTKSKAGITPVVQKSEPLVPHNVPNGKSNGYLSPASASISYWRELSRSPSPLGLIPIHRHWRSFIHRHEIPRKFLHVSIGFFTLYCYTRDVQTSDIHPWLLGLLIPISAVEVIRHRSASVNRFYIRALGALMRETEVNDKYNGVIFYLMGGWFALRFFPKDVGAMGILLLSWCDTAASTFGRLYGRYTPRIRKGKSSAGSAAAALVGIGTAWLFYGFFVPRYRGFEDSFMFQGSLSLPQSVGQALGISGTGKGILTGWLALSVLSLWTGLVASGSELVDIFGLDDNLTIPVLSSIGLWGFLKIFG